MRLSFVSIDLFKHFFAALALSSFSYVMMMHPGPAFALQQNAERGLDLERFCRATTGTSAVMDSRADAYSWHCADGSRINGEEACQRQYGSNWAIGLRSRTDAYSWFCRFSARVIASRSAPPLCPQPPVPGAFRAPGSPPCLPALPGSRNPTSDIEIGRAIAANCGNNPVCIGASWGMVQYARCAEGARQGQWGNCVYPVQMGFDRLPERLRPQTIINNVISDIRRGGVSDTNDVIGANGFLCRTLFGGC